MFSKAKLKRFNEEVGCAPPPTAYNPKVEGKAAAAVSLDKSNRWKEHAQDTPGPGAYTPSINRSTSSTSSSSTFISPKKKMASTSSTRLNSSISSNVSSNSSNGGQFLSPFPPSRLAFSGRRGGGREGELHTQITELAQERDKLKAEIKELHLRLCSIRVAGPEREGRKEAVEARGVEAAVMTPATDSEGSQTDNTVARPSQDADGDTPPPPPPSPTTSSPSLRVRLDSTQGELQEAQHTISQLQDERSGLQLRLQEVQDRPQQPAPPAVPPHLAEELDHLTQLRDNLEASLLQKEDLIAELRLQLDEVVAEGGETQRQLEASLDEYRRSRREVEGQVAGLVARYEALARRQGGEREAQDEELAKRDIEIGLLNASLSNLNSKVSEYEDTLSCLQEEVCLRGGRISQLEATLLQLSDVQRERDEREEQLSQRCVEMARVEESLVEVVEERRGLVSYMEEARREAQLLRGQLHSMEVQLKEKEVLQQFLEKEITAREEEVSQSSSRVQDLEGELETVRRVALDLQEDAEAKLNEMLCLKATFSAKEYDLMAQSDLITTLQQEVSQKANETVSLQERFEAQVSVASRVEEDLDDKTKQVARLEAELSVLRRKVEVGEERCGLLEENTRMLEEKVVEMMGEISDREAQFVARINSMEGEMDELGVKYSDALLEHEATRRVLGQASEELEREALIREAAEGELEALREEKTAADAHLQDLVRKYTNLEDALACEEGENRDLEERLEEARVAAAAVRSELTATQTATEGFKTQITQLKIDMRKKCDAVEEMQQCIELLRDEKQHLTTLTDTLQDTLSALRLQAASTQAEVEEERVALRSRIADLENHLKEAEEEVVVEKDKVVSVKEELCGVEVELSRVEEVEREQRGRVEELEADCDGYKDQLKNLETSLQAKTEELEAHHQDTTTTTTTLQTTANTLRQEVHELNTTLTTTTTTLQTTANTLRQEVQELNTTLATRTSQLDTTMATLAARDSELKALKKVAKERKADQQTLATLKEELKATQETLARVEEEKEDSAGLRKEMEEWKSKCLHLDNMVEPFRAQLDAYEVEKSGLMKRSSAAKDEVDQLSQKYTTLLGHQNHKQKIHHVKQLKTDNSNLKEEVHKLRQEAERQRKTVRRLEEKLVKNASSSLSSTASFKGETSRLCPGDKENTTSSSASFFEPPSLSSTPLRPSNRPQRL